MNHINRAPVEIPAAPLTGLDPADVHGELVPWWVDDAPNGRALRPGLFALLLWVPPAIALLWSTTWP